MKQKNVKGIILAGGKGTRLFPITKVVSKQLLPIYDKPMIYYPLSTLMLTGIKEILIISTEDSLDLYRQLLGNGNELGLEIQYKVQNEAKGIAEAFIIGEDFIGDDNVCLILGDNVFYGQNLSSIFEDAYHFKDEALIFAYPVKNPTEFGVVEFDDNLKAISLEEKPSHPKSNYAVPGLYFYKSNVVEIAKNIEASNRGELEITSVNNEYLKKGTLSVKMFGRGMAWLDTGTPKGLKQASEYVETIQERQGLYIACIEEIAWRKGYITLEQMLKIGESMCTTDYGKYILEIGKM